MAPLDHSVQGSLATHNSRLVQVARLRRLSRTFVAVRAKSRSGSISSTHGVCHSACLVIFVSTSKPFTNYIYHLICISLHYTTYIIMKIQTALVRNVYRVHSHVYRPARDRHDATYHLRPAATRAPRAARARRRGERARRLAGVAGMCGPNQRPWLPESRAASKYKPSSSRGRAAHVSRLPLASRLTRMHELRLGCLLYTSPSPRDA